MPKKKWYTVWRGRETGVFDTWEECAERVKGYPSAAYKAFPTRLQAEQALREGPACAVADVHKRTALQAAEISAAVSTDMSCAAGRDTRACPDKGGDENECPAAAVAGGNGNNGPAQGNSPYPQGEALAVDAACSGNPGMMEYRGVMLPSGREVFHFGPLWGTNNVGEFLAIVHAAALLHRQGRRLTVYSDSRNALLWVERGQCRTKLPRSERSEPLFLLIDRAEQWLRNHPHGLPPMRKWHTSLWGEIPADFGRK